MFSPMHLFGLLPGRIQYVIWMTAFAIMAALGVLGVVRLASAGEWGYAIVPALMLAFALWAMSRVRALVRTEQAARASGDRPDPIE